MSESLQLKKPKKAKSEDPQSDQLTQESGSASENESTDQIKSFQSQANKFIDDSTLDFYQGKADEINSSENPEKEKSDLEEENEEADKTPGQDISEKVKSLLSGDPSSDEEDTVKKTSLSVELKPETLILSGKKGLYATLSGFFGKETSFGKLRKLVHQFEQEEDDDKKKGISAEIIAEGQNWLKKHPKPKKPKGLFGRMKAGFNRLRGKTQDDDKKRDSIGLIVKRFQESGDTSKIKLTTLSDKQSVTSKVKGLFGFKTTFKQIEDKYHIYQSKASSTITSYDDLKSILEDARDVVQLIGKWKDSHQKETDDTSNSKKNSLTKIEQGIANIFIEANLRDIISVKVSKLNLLELNNGVISAENMELKINIEKKELTGVGENVAIGENGIDFSKLDIDYNDAIIISDELQISEPKLSVSHQDGDYDIKASGDIDLSIEIPDLVLNATGNVEVNFSTETSEFHSPKLEGANFIGSMFNENLRFSATDINYEDGIFSAANGILDIDLFEKEFETEVMGLTISKDEFDWDEATLKIDKLGIDGLITANDAQLKLAGKSKNYAYEISGDLDVSVPMPDGFVLNTRGTVSVSGVPNESEYDVNITDGGFDLAVGNIIKASAEGINYDQSVGKISADSASLTLNLLEKEFETDVTGLAITKDEIDWDEATLKIDKLGVEGLVSVKDAVATVSGKEGNYAKHAEGSLEIPKTAVPGATISAENVKVAIKEKDGEWSFGLKGDTISVGLLGEKLKLVSKSLKYENKKLEMETLDITLKLPIGKPLEAEGKGVVIESGNVDWKEIRFKLPKLIPDIGSLKFENGDGILKGKKNDYALGLENVEAAIASGDWFKANGNVNLLWNHKNEKLPEIEAYAIEFELQSPKIPDAFMPPGTWPVGFNLVMPFMAGIIPMEAEVGMNAKAGGSIKISGSINKAGEASEITGSGDGIATLIVTLKGSLGVGSKLLVKLAAFLKGEAKADASLELGLDGILDKEFNITSLTGNYKVNADFIAKLTGGIEAQALLVFSKTLYEIELKKWVLGTSERSGDYDFINKQDKQKETSGLFKGKEIKFPGDIDKAPDIQNHSKEYMQAMDKFYAMLNENSEINVKTEESKEEIIDSKKINSKKDRLIAILERTIEENLSNKEYKKFRNKLSADEKRLNDKKEKQKIFIDRQEKKLAEAPKKTNNIFSKNRDKPHYQNKIQKATKKYQIIVGKDLKTLKKNLGKVSIYENQITTATAYIKSIDPILNNPDLGLSEVDAQINLYLENSKEAKESKYSIDNYLLKENLFQIEIKNEEEL